MCCHNIFILHLDSKKIYALDFSESCLCWSTLFNKRALLYFDSPQLNWRAATYSSGASRACSAPVAVELTWHLGVSSHRDTAVSRGDTVQQWKLAERGGQRCEATELPLPWFTDEDRNFKKKNQNHQTETFTLLGLKFSQLYISVLSLNLIFKILFFPQYYNEIGRCHFLLAHFCLRQRLLESVTEPVIATVLHRQEQHSIRAEAQITEGC